MRKLYPRIAWYALLGISIVLILGACVRPVGLESYLDDERVQDIIEKGKTGVGVDIGDVEELEDFPPILSTDGGTTTLEEGAVITLSISGAGGPSSVTITVVNVGDYDADTIKWSSGGILEESGDTLIVDTAVGVLPPFDVIRQHVLVVEGKIDGTPYETLINIDVVE